MRSRSTRTDWHRDTQTQSLCVAPVGPLRSSLMNIISVYRKQAFITSSRLAARHTELHTHTYTHMCTHVPWHTASHIFVPPLSPPLRLVEEAITILSAPSHPTSFISFVWSPSLSPRVSLQMLYFSELLCMALCATSACWPPSVSNQSAIKIHTHRHSPHGPAYCVVHQLSCKPAFIQMYANGILTNPTADN